MNKKIFFLLCLMTALSGCSSEHTLAPVIDASEVGYFEPTPDVYIVQPKDSLYSIAFRFDKDYQSLAALNGLIPPYRLSMGQQIIFKKRPSKLPQPSVIKKTYNPPSDHHRSSALFFVNPTQSKHILHPFSPHKGQKGIDILGYRGLSVVAVESGRVVYVGERLSGYGSLILIKHSKAWISAYAHNSKHLVREGQYVKRGQKIADMGMLDRLHWGLHFEIRKQGLPINPLTVLGKPHWS